MLLLRPDAVANVQRVVFYCTTAHYMGQTTWNKCLDHVCSGKRVHADVRFFMKRRNAV